MRPDVLGCRCGCLTLSEHAQENSDLTARPLRYLEPGKRASEYSKNLGDLQSCLKTRKSDGYHS